MSDSELKRFNEGVSYLKRVGKLKQCFYPDPNICEGAIIQAHSIQMNGRLSLLELNINGQSGLYSLSSFIPFQGMRYGIPKLLGKGEVSTFFGFCRFHDKTLFAPIEDEDQLLSLKQLFLHSYRSFAYWHHKQRELLRAVADETKYDIKTGLDKNFFTSNIQLLAESEDGKSKLNEMLISESFDKLKYHVRQTDQTHLVASSDVVIPYYYLDDQPIYETSIAGPHAKVILTILPGKDNTIFIMACLPDDLKASKFIDGFRSLPLHEFEYKISSLLIYSRGNTFYSPLIWNQISELDKNFLRSELNNLHYEESTGETLFESYFNSDVNLFSFSLSTIPS